MTPRLKEIAARIESRSFTCAYAQAAVMYLLSEIARRDEQLRAARDALTSISSSHKPRHAKEEYWLKVAHEQCAVVLATDTKIARQALKEIGDRDE